MFGELGPLSKCIEKAIDDSEDAQNTADAQVNSKADEIQTLEDQKKRHERVEEHNNDPAVMLDKARAEAQRFGDLSIKYPDDEYYAAQAQIAIDKANELHMAIKSSVNYYLSVSKDI